MCIVNIPDDEAQVYSSVFQNMTFFKNKCVMFNRCIFLRLDVYKSCKCKSAPFLASTLLYEIYKNNLGCLISKLNNINVQRYKRM